MKKAIKYILYALLGLLVLILVIAGVVYIRYGMASSATLATLGPEAPTLTAAGVTYRDLNKNGLLDPYEDVRLPTEERVTDLLGQMTLEEKAGMMFITMIAVGADGTLQERPSPTNPFSLMLPTNSDMVVNRHMNHFNATLIPEPVALARWHNALQKLAERTRLGIPITLGTDPRHAFSNNPGANLMAGDFSQWPEPLGLAATRDTALVKAFADMARQEYRAVGFRLGLHPQVDLATEPRWGRINGTFGEDAALTARMAYAYITGFQGDTLGTHSVAMMTKHFSGGGPQKDGDDAHFAFGKEQVYPGNNFDYHLLPFENGAFKANTAQIMPYYGIPVGQTEEEVGFAFNKAIITDLLREHYGFDGVVCSDWAILQDMKLFNRFVFIEAIAWGVEDLTPEQRLKKALDAGIDQIGGGHYPELVVSLVESGQVTEERVDQSVRRLLRDKFTLGLFDDPYVDTDAVTAVVGRADFVAAGEEAQRKAIVLLKNGPSPDSPVLPLQNKPRIYIENIDPVVAATYGTVVETLEEADLAILRLQTPHYPRPEASFFEGFFHRGDLDFKGEEKERILSILRTKPTVVDIYMDRPAVIPDIAAEAAALVANFGANDAALLDILWGHFNPVGTLPIEMPSSMEAVEKQYEDVPYDSEVPLFPFGHGLSYETP